MSYLKFCPMGDINAYVFNHYFDEMIIQPLPGLFMETILIDDQDI